MLTIETPNNPKSFALFDLGFRPFFLLAGLSATLLMALWMALYLFQAPWLPVAFPAMLWHGHEMVFGFSIAVIAGFLLTAVRNWTSVQTLHGKGLIALALLWLIARVLPFTGLPSALVWMASFDLLFMAGLITALSLPIVQVKQWKQLPIVLKVALMMAANALFYLGLLGMISSQAMYWGLYSGLYLVVSLIMMMGRRVIPFFIEKGVDEDIHLRNWKWLDISSLFLFLVFIITEVFFQNPESSSLLAAILFILHAIRLWGWYSKGIWKKPLLWVLYVGYSFLVLGFGLKMVTSLLGLSPWLSIHAFAVGGIGIVTAGMMSRVALGHTGRNVFSPPPVLQTIFLLLTTAAIIRVIGPLLLPGFYPWLIGIAQICWISGFGLFVMIYAPMLIKTRVDGRFG
ncbi:MAG TPA: NnrS family protein [Gammaproteobacteria bacterium]|nr:NnrS family protein [Gammaproteobacteria bacterium]